MIFSLKLFLLALAAIHDSGSSASTSSPSLFETNSYIIGSVVAIFACLALILLIFFVMKRGKSPKEIKDMENGK